MDINFIDSLTPDQLSEYATKVCGKMKNSPDGATYDELIYIQRRLRRFRIRVANVNNGIHLAND